MKRKYDKPAAVKIDYVYDDQIVAQSPEAVKADPERVDVCTWADQTCFMMYYVPTKARGTDNCAMYPGVPLPKDQQ